MAVVVLPTPPFWLAKAMRRTLALSITDAAREPQGAGGRRGGGGGLLQHHQVARLPGEGKLEGEDLPKPPAEPLQSGGQGGELLLHPGPLHGYRRPAHPRKGKRSSERTQRGATARATARA